MTDTVQMPLGRYFAFAGGLLLALLFAADWLLPKAAVAESRAAQTSGIRISSTEKWPERIVIDTALPTIVPPAAPVVAAVALPLDAGAVKIPSQPRDAFALATPEPRPAALPVHKKIKTARKPTPPLNRLASNQVAPVRSPWPFSW